ncbi:MAG: antirepressor regulating drug resistance protein, partial [Planctomycetaceae bacterium]|nr:antirepressor regulating drug resistance protein [Planctomycetaceae bacterium]
MTSFLRELTAWLIDYYAASTMLLIFVGTARAFLRQPIHRMALSWATFGGLALLIGLCATPSWPRMTLRQRHEQPLHVDSGAASAVFPQRALEANASHRLIKRSQALPIAAPLPDRIAASPSPATPEHTLETLWPGRDILLALAFLSGASIVSIWELVGFLQVRQLRRAARPAPEFAFQELKCVVPGDDRIPQLLISARINAAVAVGIRRPAIVLPSDSLAASERIVLRSLLAHEWAHIRCYDLWLLAVARFLLIFLYAQPLYWWLRRQIRMDQEVLADATAAEACGCQIYAESLVIWARRQPRRQPRLAGVIGIWESPGQLTRRIAMLLDEKYSILTRSSRRWQVGVYLTTAALVIALSLVTLRPSRAARASEPPREDTKPGTANKSVGVVADATNQIKTPDKTAVKKSELLEIDGT